VLNTVTWPGTGQAVPIDEPLINLVEAFQLLKRQRRVFAIVFAFVITCAVTYLVITPPRYTASALLLFDAHPSDGLQQPTVPSPATDSAYVDSQIEVLRSDAIARAVITKLNLDTDPEFVEPASPVLAALSAAARFLRRLITAPDMDANSDPLGPFVAFFQSNLQVKRVGMTYVAEISYRSRDRAKAAKISNAIVEAYIFAQLDSKYRAAGQAAAWIQERVRELETQAQSAERAVAEYKAKNNVAETRGLSDAELATISGQRRAALADLESKAQTYRSLHESFVQRAGQQMLPTTDARLVSAAVPPIEKSDPKVLLVLAAACLVGAVGGVAAAFAREHLNGAFVSPGQLEKELGTRCLGLFPSLPKRASGSGRADAAGGERLRGSGKGQENARRLISRDPHRYTRAIDEPFSLWSESIRFLATEVMGQCQHGCVIGVGSALAGEGKSMAAANLAQLIADAGRKVLLVDCDLRNPGLTRRLAPEATQGLLDGLANDKMPLDDFVWRDPATGLHFLPAPRRLIQTVHPTRTLSSDRMQKLLTRAQETYDYVILDLPPISPVADVKAISQFIDSFVLVVEWGRTPQAAVVDALNSVPAVAGKLMGAVLNKASSSALTYAESYRARPPA
jgi:capsular exopolysaccharide synthesis family protein